MLIYIILKKAIYSRVNEDISVKKPDLSLLECYYQNDKTDINKFAEYVVELPENKTIRLGTEVHLKVSLELVSEQIELAVECLETHFSVEPIKVKLIKLSDLANSNEGKLSDHMQSIFLSHKIQK